jgi:peptidoglycan/xylan/chitin deacetylase (PgdA/CDA1 family)
MTVESAAPRGRLALTFDNLGEASELERGTWPMDRPLGEHPSVAVALPRLLDELEAHGLTATFVLEAINCEMYPDAVREIAARGHEVGHHGWQHEAWAALSPRDESDALQRGRRAFDELGVRVRAFRPPGGELTPSSPGLLLEAGIEWCSPALDPAPAAAPAAPGVPAPAAGPAAPGAPGAPAAPALRHAPFDWNELRYLPFDWPAVDAYHLTARFAELRRERGDPSQARAPREVLELFSARVEVAAAGGGAPEVLVMHPFLMVQDEWWECVRELLAKIAVLASGGALRVAPGDQLARPLGAALSPS